MGYYIKQTAHIANAIDIRELNLDWVRGRRQRDVVEIIHRKKNVQRQIYSNIINKETETSLHI